MGNRARPRKDVTGEVALTIQRFDPKAIPDSTWSIIGPVVREAVAAARPRNKREAAELLSRTARLVLWCHQHGLALEPEVLFAPHTIERFVAEGCVDLASGSRTNYRSVLRLVGRAVLGPVVFPPWHPLELSPRLTPYTQSDIRALVGWSRGLSTPRMRYGVISLVGLGLGAGLVSAEISIATASWVQRTDAGLSIAVPGRRQRLVPVVDEWTWAVEHAFQHSRGGLLLLPERTSTTAKRLSRFTESLPRHDACKLSAQRLRATWIVRHLDNGVPLNVLAQAAGVGPEHLSSYVQFMRAVADDVADPLLRHGARPR